MQNIIKEQDLDFVLADRWVSANLRDVFKGTNKAEIALSRYSLRYKKDLLKYYVKAGISSKFGGSRHFRHAFATRLLSQNVSIKTIADLLGHRHIETTFIYTKVNLNQLRTLAREWPENQQ